MTCGGKATGGMATAARVELPPPRPEPLAGDAWTSARLGPGLRVVARGLRAGEQVYLLVASGTRADVGSWLGASKVCAAVLADELVLLAAPRNPLVWLRWLARIGRRPAPGYVERLDAEKLIESTYNHVNGRLLLAPADGARVRQLKLPALDAHQLLAQIRHMKKDRTNA